LPVILRRENAVEEGLSNPTGSGVCCLAVLATKVSAAPLTVVGGPAIDRPGEFLIGWYIADGIGTYHGTNWDAQVTITKTNVLFTGQYLGSAGGREWRSVSWSLPRDAVFTVHTPINFSSLPKKIGKELGRYPGWYNEWSIYSDSTQSVAVQAVRAVHAPEPSTLLLFPGIGLAWIAVFWRKLCKKAQDTYLAQSVTTVPAAV
jgi:hypothetical protein